jgi:Fe-S-cluster containining protein
VPPPMRKVRLTMLGATRELDLPVPGGQGSLVNVLPAARKLTHEMMSLSTRREAERGLKVSCKAACGACCRQLVPISVVEAKSLAAVVAKMPKPRRDAVLRRFEVALAKLEASGLLPPISSEPRTALVSAEEGDEAAAWDDVSHRYFALQIACPFLEKESCSIYEDRPVICREYLVTSDPALCGSIDGGARSVPRPTFPSRGLAVAAERLDGVPPSSIPLTLALEWAEARGHELAATHTGTEMMNAFLDSLVWGEELDDVE